MSLPTYEYLGGLQASYEGSAFGFGTDNSFLINPVGGRPSLIIVVVSELASIDGTIQPAIVTILNSDGSNPIPLGVVGQTLAYGGQYNRSAQYFLLFSPGAGARIVKTTHTGYGGNARQKAFHTGAHAYYSSEVLSGVPRFFYNSGASNLASAVYPNVSATSVTTTRSELFAGALCEYGSALTNIAGTVVFNTSLTYTSTSGATTLLGVSGIQRITPSTTTGALWSYTNSDLAGRYWDTGLLEILSGERIITLTKKTVSVTKKTPNVIITEDHQYPQSVTLPAPKIITARVKKLYTYKSNYDVGAVIVRLPKLGDNGFRRIKVFRNPKKPVVDSDYIGDLQRTPYLKLDGTVASSLSVAADGTISQWSDLSGNSLHFTQNTTGNRPVLSRSDNIENFLTYSEQPSQVDWDKAGYPVTVAENDIANYAGDIISTKITCSSGSGQRGLRWANFGAAARLVLIGQANQYIMEADVKAGTCSYMWFGTSADSPWHGTTVNLSNGTFIDAGTNIASQTATSLGNGWYRIKLVITASFEFKPDAGFWFQNNTNGGSPLSTAWTGTETFYISRPQLRHVGTDQTYIKTTTSMQIAGVGGKAVPYFPSDVTYMFRAFDSKLDIGVGDNSIHVVCSTRRSNIAGSANVSCLMNTNAASSASGVLFDLATNSDGKCHFATYDGSGHDTLSAKLPIADCLYVIGVAKTNSNSSPIVNIYVNGVVNGTPNQAATNALTASPNAIGIGNRASGNHGLRGLLAEFVIYPGISQAETKHKNKYLQLKYGLDNKKSTPPTKALTVARSDLLLISFQPKFRATYGAIAETPGYWLNNDGHLNTNKYIQDSDYYQQFSYELQCGEPFTVFEKIMKKLLHPVGYKMFGKFVSESSVDSTISSVTSELTTDNVIDLP